MVELRVLLHIKKDKWFDSRNYPQDDPKFANEYRILSFLLEWDTLVIFLMFYLLMVIIVAEDLELYLKYAAYMSKKPMVAIRGFDSAGPYIDGS